MQSRATHARLFLSPYPDPPSSLKKRFGVTRPRSGFGSVPRRVSHRVHCVRILRGVRKSSHRYAEHPLEDDSREREREREKESVWTRSTLSGKFSEPSPFSKMNFRRDGGRRDFLTAERVSCYESLKIYDPLTSLLAGTDRVLEAITCSCDRI
jgi:hypothetical protein